MSKITQDCHKYNLLDVSKYNDINLNKSPLFSGLVKSNKFTVDNYFLDVNESSLSPESYKQFYFTGIDPSLVRDDIPKTDQTTKSRLKRLKKTNEFYAPEADELNYTFNLGRDYGVFDEIFSFFSSKLLRIRLAAMKPNFSIKPHVDYDPSYVTRYHFPIQTNDQSKMHVKRKQNGLDIITSTHFPADGGLYFLNTGREHWASNDGENYRVHLIIDVHGQKELEMVL